MPYHKLLDCYEEDRLADAKYGSTRRGIAPVYGDKYMKKSAADGRSVPSGDHEKAPGGHRGPTKI